MEKIKMIEVKFYDTVEDEKLEIAIIISKTNGKWVFCKHKERDTFEHPGGHREPGEDILTTAKRELAEETGAVDFDIQQVCVYSVTEKTGKDNDLVKERFGMLYFADIRSFEKELHSEIEKVIITDQLPTKWTYPYVQPHLFAQVEKLGYL